PPTPATAPPTVLGAWSADGQTFTWVIDPDSILFEIDMLKHSYTTVGDTLLIDRGDPTIGIQKTRIVRVTADSLFIQDVMSGTSEVLVRLR
ncbi:MAG TPA: hypothetical protein VGC44_05100, partial [Longimicrobiales bacterium]